QAAQVPSSNVTCRFPRSLWKNCRMVSAFVSMVHSITSLPAESTTAIEGRSSKAVEPVRGCLKRAMVRIVTRRLMGHPASLDRQGGRITHPGPPGSKRGLVGNTEVMKRQG